MFRLFNRAQSGCNHSDCLVLVMFLICPAICDCLLPGPRSRPIAWVAAHIRGGKMVARVRTVAFQGIEAVPVDVQVMIAPGKVGMQIVGLPDKAVAESRERVQ